MAGYYIGAIYSRVPPGGIEQAREIISTRERYRSGPRFARQCLPDYLARLRHVEGKAFFMERLDAEFPSEPFQLEVSSREFGEAMGIGVETYEDRMFRYDHWKEGILLRRLCFEEEWSAVEGEVEPWEDAVFKAGLAQALHLDEDNAERIREACAPGNLVAGAAWPVYGTRALVALEAHFSLPPMIWIRDARAGAFSPP